MGDGYDSDGGFCVLRMMAENAKVSRRESSVCVCVTFREWLKSALAFLLSIP